MPASTASHDAAPAPAMSAMIKSERQNEDAVIRRNADAVLNNSNTNNGDQNSSAQPKPTSTTPSSVASTSSMKRQRPGREPKVPYPVPSDDEDESQQTSFFLKHQNRALASELKALQYQLSLLEGERSYRRQQCRIASQALNSLQATWTQMETELQQQPQHALNKCDARDSATFVEQDAPMSTGKGTHVEILGALFDALASMANTVPAAAARRDQENGDEDDVPNRRSNQDLDPVEKQQLDDLSNISWNILQRANTLEEWIRSMLQKLTNSSGADASQQPTLSTSDQMALNKEIGILRGQCREYKIQIAELAKARDDTAKSERKVRRGIYRLSTGRVKIDQVLKDMEKSDEDGTLAAEAKMEALAESQASSAALQPPPVANASQDTQTPGIKQEPGAAVDSQEVQRIRKQIEEMEQQLSTRDKSIEEVRSAVLELQCSGLWFPH